MDLEHILPVTQSSFIKVKQGSGDRMGCCGESQYRSLAFLRQKQYLLHIYVFPVYIWGKQMSFVLHNRSSHTRTTLTVYKANVM